MFIVHIIIRRHLNLSGLVFERDEHRNMLLKKEVDQKAWGILGTKTIYRLQEDLAIIKNKPDVSVSKGFLMRTMTTTVKRVECNFQSSNVLTF